MEAVTLETIPRSPRGSSPRANGAFGEEGAVTSCSVSPEHRQSSGLEEPGETGAQPWPSAPPSVGAPGSPRRAGGECGEAGTVEGQCCGPALLSPPRHGAQSRGQPGVSLPVLCAVPDLDRLPPAKPDGIFSGGLAGYGTLSGGSGLCGLRCCRGHTHTAAPVPGYCASCHALTGAVPTSPHALLPPPPPSPLAESSYSS